MKPNNSKSSQHTERCPELASLLRSQYLGRKGWGTVCVSGDKVTCWSANGVKKLQK